MAPLAVSLVSLCSLEITYSPDPPFLRYLEFDEFRYALLLCLRCDGICSVQTLWLRGDGCLPDAAATLLVVL